MFKSDNAVSYSTVETNLFFILPISIDPVLKKLLSKY